MPMLLRAVGPLVMGWYFIKASFSRELRPARTDAEPVIRSDKVDGYIQIAWFVSGALFAVIGLFMMLMLVPLLF